MLDRRFTAGRRAVTTRRRIATLPRRTGSLACTTSECVARLGRDHPRRRVNLRPSICSASSYGARPPSQLRDHRAHRPREVDARGSHPRADGRRRRARHARAGARLDGARARARDHDQGPGGASPLARPLPEPDRHPRARRLQLRGLALPASLRGGVAPRRRFAGHPGADARKRVPRARQRPGDRRGRQQDRPAAG